MRNKSFIFLLLFLIFFLTANTQVRAYETFKDYLISCDFECTDINPVEGYSCATYPYIYSGCEYMIEYYGGIENVPDSYTDGLTFFCHTYDANGEVFSPSAPKDNVYADFYPDFDWWIEDGLFFYNQIDRSTTTPFYTFSNAFYLSPMTYFMPTWEVWPEYPGEGAGWPLPAFLVTGKRVTASVPATCCEGAYPIGPGECPPPPPPSPSAPTGVTVQPGVSCDDDWLDISWGSVSGATNYLVYRDGGETAVYSGIEASFKDSGLTLDSEHYYTVKAVNDGGSSSPSDPPVYGTVAEACPPAVAQIYVYADEDIVDYNTSTNINWSYIDANNCTITGQPNPSVYPDSYGSASTGNLLEDTIFEISCLPVGLNSYDSVTIEVKSIYNLNITKSGQGLVTGEAEPPDVLPTINCGNECANNYDEGINIHLIATPDPGKLFIGWTGGCDSSYINPDKLGGTCDVTINSDKNIKAHFIVDPKNYTQF